MIRRRNSLARYAEIETIDKRKNTSKGSKRRLLINLKEILRRRRRE
jgi:hypothetical protein